MMDRDLNLLQEAYRTVLETDLSTLAMGQPTEDDYADRATPHEISQAPQPSQDQGETAWHKAKVAFDKATLQNGKNVDEETVKAIAGDQETAERYGVYLLQHGLQIPQIIKMASPNYAKSLENSFNSNTKN